MKCFRLRLKPIRSSEEADNNLPQSARTIGGLLNSLRLEPRRSPGAGALEVWAWEGFDAPPGMIRVLVQRYLTVTGQLTNRLTLGLTLQNPAYASDGEYGFVCVHRFDKSNFKARL